MATAGGEKGVSEKKKGRGKGRAKGTSSRTVKWGEQLGDPSSTCLASLPHTTMTDAGSLLDTWPILALARCKSAEEEDHAV